MTPEIAIAELDQAAQQFLTVSLLVDCCGRYQQIFHNDENRLTKLIGALRDGGKVVATMGVDLNLEVLFRIHDDRPEVRRIVEREVKTCEDLIRADRNLQAQVTIN